MEFNLYNGFVFWLPWSLGILTAIAAVAVLVGKWKRRN
jgi:hypothetical protein